MDFIVGVDISTEGGTVGRIPNTEAVTNGIKRVTARIDAAVETGGIGATANSTCFVAEIVSITMDNGLYRNTTVWAGKLGVFVVSVVKAKGTESIGPMAITSRALAAICQTKVSVLAEAGQTGPICVTAVTDGKAEVPIYMAYVVGVF